MSESISRITESVRVVGRDLEGTIRSTVVSIFCTYLYCSVNKVYFVYWTVSGWKFLHSNKRNPIQIGWNSKREILA